MPNRTMVDSATATAVSSIMGPPCLWSGSGGPGVRRSGQATRPAHTRGSGLLQQLRLLRAGHLGRQVDVARQVALAADRVRLTAHRVLEHGRGELLRARLLAAGRERDRPVDGQSRVVV